MEKGKCIYCKSEFVLDSPYDSRTMCGACKIKTILGMSASDLRKYRSMGTADSEKSPPTIDYKEWLKNNPPH
jgi:hypothetical protein